MEMREDTAERYPSSTPLKLRLPLIQTLLQSPQPSGLRTPPLHASVSVPFRWEDEPGKPRFSGTTLFPGKTLELPPRLLVLNAKSAKLEASLLGREHGRRFSPHGDIGLRGSWGRRASKSIREDNGVLKIKRNGKFSTLTHLNSHIWGAVYHGLKWIVPWGKRK